MHSSIDLGSPCEFINVVPMNPLISKCQIKVCYVGEEPNRNGSIITKDVALQMANSLPGSPIVGFYNANNKDFEEHNKSISVSNGEWKITDTTIPYGFVDMNAKVWFKKFQDDGSVEHEYLMTEGYLWTGQYPECQRILESGNNQSMELDEKTLKGNWTSNNNESVEFFIINEAIISKLCILGENFEPCFEGANITKVQFSFDDDFKTKLYSMMTELTKLLNKGGTQVFTTYSVQVGDAVWTALYSHISEKYADEYSIHGVYEDENQKYAILKNADNQFSRLDFSIDEEGVFSAVEQLAEVDASYQCDSQFSLEEVNNFISDFKKKEDKNDKKDSSENEEESEDKDSEKSEDKPVEKDEPKDDESKEEEPKEPEEKASCDEAESKDDEEDEEDKKKKKYSLEEVTEYQELLEKYNTLNNSYADLNSEHEKLLSEMAELTAFRNNIERQQKQEMIDSFYMLSDDDKSDIVKNIDTYSLDDIEAKLSVICVRNRVNFNDNLGENGNGFVYNFNNGFHQDDTVPEWLKLALDVEKNLK